MMIPSTAPATIDEVARRCFEEAWMAGQPQPIEKFIPPPDHALHRATLEELVNIELEFVWRSFGSHPTVPPHGNAPALIEHYLARFPSLNEPEIILRLLREEHRVRHAYADRPDTEEYCRRFPGLVTTADFVEGSAQEETTPRNPTGMTGYKVLGNVGRGGMGIVYEALQSDLGRVVALKVIRSNKGSSSQDRFIAEARLAARLEHPGVVPVHELVMPTGAEPYYTMKLIRGQTLTEAVRHFHGEPKSPGETAIARQRLLGVFLSVCRTMEFAHARGVIHRDLKPANIVLGSYGETVILDWGLAKILRDTEGSTSSDLKELLQADETLQGSVLGTPAYMAPEQARGNIDQIDERSDIYALGAILYQILTNQPPFSGDTATVLELVISTDPKRPRGIDPTIPPPLEAICLHALAKQPTSRYQTASVLGTDLERFLAGEPVSVYRESRITRVARWARRHRTTVTSAGVAFTLLIIGAVAGIFLEQRAEYTRKKQADEFEQRRLSQAREHLVALENAAKGDETLAVAETHAGRFASAETILHKATRSLENEEGLAPLRDRLEAQRLRAHRIAEFYRLWNRTELLAIGSQELGFTRIDEEALTTCLAALKHLGIFDDPAEWWTHLPATELLPWQFQRLQDDTAIALGMVALWQTKKGFKSSFFGINAKDPNSIASYRAALDSLQMLQTYHQARYKRLSSAAEVLQFFCRYLLDQRDNLRPLRMDVQDAGDAYFLGVAHVFLADPMFAGVSKTVMGLVSKDVLKFSGLDFDTPLVTAERMLRLAVSLDPQHYWAHYWLGRCLSTKRDFSAAEQAFNTCVGLRPDYVPGYTERARTLIRSAIQQENEILPPNALDNKAMWGVIFRRTPPNCLASVLDQYLYLDASRGRIPWSIRPRKNTEPLKKRAFQGLAQAPTAIHLDPSFQWARAWCFDATNNINERFEASSSAIELEMAQQLVNDGKGAKDRDVSADVTAFVKRWGQAKDANTPDLGSVLAKNQPRTFRALTTRGLLFLRKRKVEAALADFDMALAERPKNLLASLGRARTLELREDWAAGLAAYDQIFRDIGPVQGELVDWRQLEVHLGRARAFAGLKQTEDARQALEEARRIDVSAAEYLASKFVNRP